MFVRGKSYYASLMFEGNYRGLKPTFKNLKQDRKSGKKKLNNNNSKNSSNGRRRSLSDTFTVAAFDEYQNRLG